MEKNVENEILNTIYYELGLKNLDIRDVNDKAVVVDSLSNNISFVLKNTDIDRLGLWHQLVEVAKSDKIDERYVSDNYELPYPFEKFKIADILAVTDYIYINDFENNGFNTDEWKVLKDFLSYNFFLTLEIQEYLKRSYKIQAVGLDMPKVSDYINVLIEKVSGYILASVRLHLVPSADDLKTRFGLYSSDDMSCLVNIIEFYIYNMGLKQSKEEPGKLVNLSEEERVDVDGIVESVYEKIKEKISAKKALEGKLRGNI